MDVLTTKSELLRGLFLLQSVTEKRTTMPILTNALLTASDNVLKISSTDLEITSVVSLKATVKDRGSTTANARIFSEIVRELPEGEVRLTVTEGERLEISSQKTKIKIIGTSSDEYPGLPGVSFEVKGRVSSRELLEMINKTVYAVSNDETRYNLSGVCFESVQGSKKGQTGLRMVATDGHRLSMITRPLDGFTVKEKVIVPKKGLAEVKKIIDSEDEEERGVEIKDGFLVVDSRDSKLSVRLIDGEFPDYSQVIPKDKGVVAFVESADIGQALRRVALMVSDKVKCVKLDFAPETLRISSSSPELGEATEELFVDYSGKPISVGFNARYVLDFLASIGEERRVGIELHGETGPGRFFLEEDDSYMGIIMPMRLV